jgi:hypothetical protein
LHDESIGPQKGNLIMPWNVKKAGEKWDIVKETTGKVVGKSTSKKKAQASVRARYAATAGESLKNTLLHR